MLIKPTQASKIHINIGDYIMMHESIRRLVKSNNYISLKEYTYYVSAAKPGHAHYMKYIALLCTKPLLAQTT